MNEKGYGLRLFRCICGVVAAVLLVYVLAAVSTGGRTLAELPVALALGAGVLLALAAAAASLAGHRNSSQKKQ